MYQIFGTTPSTYPGTEMAARYIHANGPWWRGALRVGEAEKITVSNIPNSIELLKGVNLRIIDPFGEDVPVENPSQTPQQGFEWIFTPAKIGEYTIHICSNNEHIKGSPFKVNIGKSAPVVLSELKKKVSEYYVVARDASGKSRGGVNCTCSLAKEVEDGTFTLEMLYCLYDQPWEGPHYRLLDALMAHARITCHSYESGVDDYLDLHLAKSIKRVPLSKLVEVTKDLLHYLQTEEMSLRLLTTVITCPLLIIFKGESYLISRLNYSEDGIIAIFDENGHFVEIGCGMINMNEWNTDLLNFPFAHMFKL